MTFPDGRKWNRRYTAGAALFDKQDPTKLTAITKKPLKDLGFPENAIIAGVVRGSDSFIAVGDTRIEDYDRVAIFALPQTIKAIDRFFKV